MIKRVELETFCYESEDQGRVEQALRNVATGEITSERVYSHLGTRITRLKMKVGDIPSFMEKIRPLEIDPIQRMEDNVVHIRLSKQAAYMGKIQLDTRDVINAKIHVQAYPARKAGEEAIKHFRFQKNKL